MRLERLTIEGFRGYNLRSVIEVGQLTAFIGKNDVGKSTILEALDAFFNDNIDAQDLSVQNAEKRIVIGCTFSSLPAQINLDAQSVTTLKQEFLLNEDGKLEIYKVWKATTTKVELERIYVNAHAPSALELENLLFLKREELRAKADELQLDANRNRNPDMRAAIYDHFERTGQMAMQNREVDLDVPKDKDAKFEESRKIWKKLNERHLPVYSLFKSEQVQGDKEATVRTPLATTLKIAIKALEADLKPIADQIEAAVKDTTERTLERLRKDYPDVARNLSPEYKPPTWSSAFSLDVLRGDDDIPLNKRGAGVRRLVVLAFFQAEAEKKKAERADGMASPPVIYAIEEPETSQHPDFQRNIITAFEALAEGGDQVLLTTHVPGIAALIPTDAIRLVTRDTEGKIHVEAGSEDVFLRVVEAVGLSPDRRAKVAFYVEGPNDVEFLIRAARLHRAADHTIPDLESDHRIAFVPTGGGNLKHWVNKKYLANAQFVEVHVYDTDDQHHPKYADAIAAVNGRMSQDIGYLTSKRELENYIHADAIAASLGCHIVSNDWSDVPALVAEQVHVASGSPNAWATLDGELKRKKSSQAKRRLNMEVVDAMTLPQLQQMDPHNEIYTWLCAVRDRCA